ncbi:hypothetical protein DFH09DRAFT_1198709 [Mycena vulgaris]|nr:hypothetical protein DFH09DRAFT_1198709 [Mycena vulgaris]
MLWCTRKSPSSRSSRMRGQQYSPTFTWYHPVSPLMFPSPHPPQLMLYTPNEPRIVLNPQLMHHRSLLHPHLDWDAATSPYRDPTLKIYGFHLEQFATSPPVKSLVLALCGTAASRFASWGTIHVERTNGRPLSVDDVLNAIHVHLTRPLKWGEITGMPLDDWERVVEAFNRRVRDTGALDAPQELVMLRLDFLDGQTLFDGIQSVGGELQLSLV